MRNASAQVFDHLRDLVVTLVLAPGTQLHRNELAEYYGLSSTPLRDALSRLGEEGLVDIVPQQTTTVSRIDVGAARQAHLLRLSLELEVVNTLARAPDAMLGLALEQHIARQQLAARQGDDAALARAGKAFHRQLFEHAHLGDLWELLQRQSGNLERLQRLQPAPDPERALADHAALAGAIAGGDGRLAMDCMRRCLGDALAGVDEIRERYPEYLAAER